MNLKNLIGGYAPQDINERIIESIKLRSPFQHFATLLVKDREGIIKGIKQSKPNNLITDNFGTWLAGFFQTPTITYKSVNLKGDDGAVNSVFIYGTVTSPAIVFNNRALSPGTHIMLGSGITAAARSDYAIETALATSPEDTFFDTGTGSYGAGTISVAGAVTAGGVGTINEVGMFAVWFEETGDAMDDHMLFHDILVSGEVFVATDSLTATYTINL